MRSIFFFRHAPRAAWTSARNSVSLHFIPTSRSKETHLGAIASIGLILQSVSASLDVVHTPCFMVSGKQLSYTSYVSAEKGTRQETKYSTSLHQGAPRIDTS
ncbi:hypothetical protein ABZX51_001253 [Aspergillus tubingensis]